MGVFIALYLYLLFVGAISHSHNSDNEKRRRIQNIACGFGLWIILALRSPLCGVDLFNDGPDSVSYYFVFSKVQTISFLDVLNGELAMECGMEWGWVVYTKMVSLFTSSFQVFLAVTAFIEIYYVGRVINRLSPHIILSYMTFFSLGLYLHSFSTIRQLLAVSIVAYSFLYLIDNQKKKFVLTVMLATTLHMASIAFLLLWPLSRFNFSFRKGLMSLGLLILILPYVGVIAQLLVYLIFRGNRFSFETDEGGAVTMFIVYALLFVASYGIKRQTDVINLLRITIFLAVAGQSLGYVSVGHITRVAFFFSVFFVILVPLLVDYFVEKKLRRFTILLITLVLFVFFELVSKGGYLNVVPYSFFWEKPLPI